MALPSSGPASASSPPQSGSGELSKRARILLVEDEPDIVRGLTDVLEFEGWREGAGDSARTVQEFAAIVAA